VHALPTTAYCHTTTHTVHCSTTLTHGTVAANTGSVCECVNVFEIGMNASERRNHYMSGTEESNCSMIWVSLAPIDEFCASGVTVNRHCRPGIDGDPSPCAIRARFETVCSGARPSTMTVCRVLPPPTAVTETSNRPYGLNEL
jgi:hypothetical protein